MRMEETDKSIRGYCRNKVSGNLLYIFVIRNVAYSSNTDSRVDVIAAVKWLVNEECKCDIRSDSEMRRMRMCRSANFERWCMIVTGSCLKKDSGQIEWMKDSRRANLKCFRPCIRHTINIECTATFGSSMLITYRRCRQALPLILASVLI